ncbi:MAG: YebC/PmpR family DNA-binding transcriptional regulator [Bacteroidales bacterium]|jgi:YebC/PmpR family DNA-binding regulatory protein|nr:YebC/PmpR family DNA-binding transcriptional regulator [Bacteroidales bacterium]
MSGHSKWSTIKRKKGALDAKRSKIFSRLAKEITIAARDGGSDIEMNPRLRSAVQNAKAQNMPKDNIERAVSKANSDDAALQENTFEGYGTSGVAVFVECLSDNNNRTVSNVRAIYTKYNGSLGKNGSLSFLFDRKGVFTIPRGDWDLEELELELIDAGVEEIEEAGDVLMIYCPLESFGDMQAKLEAMDIEPENSVLQRIPNNTQKVDVDTAKTILKMIDAFEDDDDVQNVFHNMEMTDEIMEALEE